MESYELSIVKEKSDRNEGEKEMINWTEEDIRAEIARLDELTGLNGASLPIEFSYQKGTLGMFFMDGAPKGKRFRFSLHFFHGDKFTRAEALDVIRHEYAHYMDWELNGAAGHGKSWKLCCQKVGACPTRLYTNQFAAGARYLQRQEDQRKNRRTFQAGQKLLHLDFGIGVIRAVTPSGSTQLLTVEFPQATKILEAGWAEENCAYDPIKD